MIRQKGYYRPVERRGIVGAFRGSLGLTSVKGSFIYRVDRGSDEFDLRVLSGQQRDKEGKGEGGEEDPNSGTV